jgi:hypothetical protein
VDHLEPTSTSLVVPSLWLDPPVLAGASGAAVPDGDLPVTAAPLRLPPLAGVEGGRGGPLRDP